MFAVSHIAKVTQQTKYMSFILMHKFISHNLLDFIFLNMLQRLAKIRNGDNIFKYIISWDSVSLKRKF